ncbi:MAG TPA: potassium channel family protein [Propionibacteriaceae bacterium]|nr:potassium channel family protein [Propionibacteriaceae bacterium]
MTDSAAPRPNASPEIRPRARRVVVTLLRAFISTVALVALYYLLPLDRYSVAFGVGTLFVGLVGLVLLVTFQVRSIMMADFPVLRAVGALATSAPLFLLQFAASYFIMGRFSAANFSEPMTRTDALYFTVTVFATVGFGDITATSQGARVLVMGQMLLGILVVGIGARLFVDAVKQGQARQPIRDSDSG